MLVLLSVTTLWGVELSSVTLVGETDSWFGVWATVTVFVAGAVPLAPAAVRVKVYVTPVAPLMLGSVTVALVLVARSTLPL